MSEHGVRRVGPAGAWAVGWFVFLGLLVAGPLLGPGHLLLLDFPSGPRFPQVHWFPVPSSGDLGAATPFAALHAGLGALNDYLPDKLLLIAPVVLGGIGAWRLSRSRLGVSAGSSVAAGTLFAINPFVYDRYLAGQLYLLLGFALLPWAVSSLAGALPERTARSALRVALWGAALAAVSVHVAAMFALLVVAATFVGNGTLGERARWIGVVAGAGALLAAYWVLPAAFGVPPSRVGASDLGVYASRPHGVAVLPHLLSLEGFWRTEFAPASGRFPLVRLAFAPVLAVVLLGAWRAVRDRSSRLLAVLLLAISALAVLLAASTAIQTLAVGAAWLLARVPLLYLFREPQKMIALLALAYAAFAGVGVDLVASWLRGRAWRAGLLAGIVAATVASSAALLWGFAGQVSLSRYPSAWEAARAAMDRRGEGGVLFLPWHLYAVWSFSDERIVANPAASFFPGEVLTSREAGFRSVPTQSTDPFTVLVDRIVEEGPDIRHLGHVVAPLGIRYVVWAHEVDDPRYGFLERQRDLAPILRDPALTLYMNDAWRPMPIGAEGGDAGDPIGTGDEDRLPRTVFPAPPLVAAAASSWPGIARALPLWTRVEAVPEPLVVTGRRCTDGWVLGERDPSCDLGAVAAFESPDHEEILWRPRAGARLVGFSISVMALAFSVVVIRRSARREGGTRER